MSRRSKSEDYVDKHTATAVGVVLATALVPGAASVALLAQEGVMATQIARIYGRELTKSEVTGIVSHIGLAAVAGKIVALEAAILTGPASFFIKPAIAAGIIKVLGGLLIDYFENAN
jgi:uncharacterized protein (DUF697 family)